MTILNLQTTPLEETIQTGYVTWSSVLQRQLSPEVDYGVNWLLKGRGKMPLFPSWRVSWIENTGELYATPTADRQDRFVVFPRLFSSQEEVETAINGWEHSDSFFYQNLAALWSHLQSIDTNIPHIWQISQTGRLLHLIDLQGKSLCGRQFDPASLRIPTVSSNAPTLPFCARCLTAINGK